MKRGQTRGAPRLAYRLHGDRGPRVLLIMGLGMRGVAWRPQVEGLGATHRLITFDNRGIGDSEDAPGAWTMRDMAADAERVLDAAGWEDAHVVGVSMGGMIAQELVLAAPERARSLTLIATHAGGPTTFLPPIAGVRGFLEVNLLPPEQRFAALAYLLYPADFLRVVDRGALEQRMKDQLGDRASAEVRRRQLRAVMRHDTRDRLASLRAPTLVISPGRDALVRPSACRALARQIEGARLVELDQAGHGVIFQCARVVNGHLERHIEANERKITVSSPASH